jgi:hypothetical protein
MDGARTDACGAARFGAGQDGRLMAWGMLDDKFHRHPKVRALRRDGARGREALGVWLYWWSWCLDDPAQVGIVPREELPPGDVKAAALLELRGLWDPLPEGWHVHDFEDYLPGGRALRDEKREAKREADRVRIANNRAGSRENVADVARDIGDTFATPVAEVAATSRRHVAQESHTSPAYTRARDPACAPSPSPPLPAPPIPAERESADARTLSDAMPFEPDPEPPRKPSREPEAIVRRLFSEAYLATRRTVWPHAAHGREITSLADWAQAQARADGVDVERVVERVIASACADAYLVGADLPLRLIVKQAGALYRPPPKAATGPPKVLNSALIRSCEEAIEAERKKRTPNADTIASLERTVTNERAHPSGEPEDPRAAFGRRR